MFVITVVARTFAIKTEFFDALCIRHLLLHYLHTRRSSTFLAQHNELRHRIGIIEETAGYIMCAHRTTAKTSIAVAAIGMNSFAILHVDNYISILNQILCAVLQI